MFAEEFGEEEEKRKEEEEKRKEEKRKEKERINNLPKKPSRKQSKEILKEMLSVSNQPLFQEERIERIERIDELEGHFAFKGKLKSLNSKFKEQEGRQILFKFKEKIQLIISKWIENKTSKAFKLINNCYACLYFMENITYQELKNQCTTSRRICKY